MGPCSVPTTGKASLPIHDYKRSEVEWISLGGGQVSEKATDSKGREHATYPNLSFITFAGGMIKMMMPGYHLTCVKICWLMCTLKAEISTGSQKRPRLQPFAATAGSPR